MWNLLPNLHQRFPRIFCRELGTVRTLTMLNEIFDFEYLLEDRRGKDFFLDSEGDAESF